MISHLFPHTEEETQEFDFQLLCLVNDYNFEQSLKFSSYTRVVNL